MILKVEYVLWKYLQAHSAKFISYGTSTSSFVIYCTYNYHKCIPHIFYLLLTWVFSRNFESKNETKWNEKLK